SGAERHRRGDRRDRWRGQRAGGSAPLHRSRAERDLAAEAGRRPAALFSLAGAVPEGPPAEEDLAASARPRGGESTPSSPADSDQAALAALVERWHIRAARTRGGRVATKPRRHEENLLEAFP